MRRILLLMLVVTLFSCVWKNEGDIVVHFKVQNMTSSTVCLLFDRSNVKVVELDKKGQATVVLPGLNNVYVHMAYGQEVKDIFLQKDDEVTISFDARTFKDGIQFEGKNAPVIEYLNTVKHTGLDPEEYRLSFEEYSQKVNEKVAEALTLMKARKFGTVNPSFEGIEEGRIGYAYAQSLLMYPVGHVFLTNDTAYQPGDGYYDALSQKMVEREDLVDVQAYREFVKEAAGILAAKDKQLEGYYEKTVAKMKYIAEHFVNEKVKQPLINALAIDYVSQNGIKNIVELENILNTYVTEPALLDVYKKVCGQFNHAVVGQLSPDFEAKDAEGKNYSLKDFKGKYLYIDMWATWCGSCKQELPYMKKLEEKFKGKNITFLGLSTDTDQGAWENMVKSGELSGVQLLLGKGSRFQQDYNVEGIPHFILLDKEGKIINTNMLRPSSGDVEGVLAVLPGI